MKIIRVFPRRTSMTPRDDYAFVGDPPMIRPEADEVHIDCTFTWDEKRATELYQSWGQYYPDVKIGGCAFHDPCDGFIPGRYIREGITFTSRGCNNQCPWCEAWKREGKLREYTGFTAGNIIQDNNFLQCNKDHQDRVFAMLKTQRMIEFKGGLDSRLLTDRVADQLRGLKVYQLFLACDTKESIKPLRKGVNRLSGFSKDKLRCYVLLAYDGQTIPQAQAILEEVWQAGCMPFAQLYQPPDKFIDYSIEWRHLARTWSRPAIMKHLTSS